MKCRYFILGLMGCFLLVSCISFPSEDVLQNVATAEPTETAVPICTESSGQVVDFAFPLENPTRTALVYLPPCYETAVSQSYPTLYLLHGGGRAGSAQSWFNMGAAEMMDRHITNGRFAPAILIAPYITEPLAPEDWIVEELIPAVETTYRVDADRLARGVAGISMGGGEAGSVGLRHPELFGSIALIAMVSPLRGYDGYMASRITRSDEITAMIEAIPEEQTPNIYFDIGHRDNLRPTSEALILHLQDANIPSVFAMGLGGHARDYFRERLESQLRWFDTVRGSQPDRMRYTAPMPLGECDQENGRIDPFAQFDDVTIYLPPCYDQSPDHEYPVLYVLAAEHDWFALGAQTMMDELIVKMYVPPFLLVVVSQVDDLLSVKEEVELNYHVRDGAIWQSVAGIGSDANEAVAIGIEYPDLFGSIGAYRLTKAPDIEDWRLWYLEREEERPFLFLDAGNNDLATVPLQLEIQEQLRMANVPHFSTFNAGGDNDFYLDRNLQNYLFWHGRHFGRALPEGNNEND